MANEAIILKPYKIEHHPAADRLDLVTFRGEAGFVCVTGRDQFTLNDLVLYVEPDSVIPDNIKEHLEKTAKIKVTNRIRAIKLRGIISEGLCLNPVDFLKDKDIVENKDVSEILGITHYQPPAPRDKSWQNQKGSNPWYQNKGFRKYTHIDRFEKVCHCFKEGDDVHISIKNHGMNWRAGLCLKEPKNWWQKILQKLHILPKKEFLVGSHNTVRNIGKNATPLPPEMANQDLFIRAAEKYDMKLLLPILAKDFKAENIVVYGELIGWGVENPLQVGYWYGVPKGEIELRIFDILVDGRYLDMKEVENICYRFDWPVVRSIYQGPFSLDLLKFAEVVDQEGDWKGNREGIVIKVQPARHDPRMGYVVAKKINPAYLIDKTNSHFH